MNPSDTPYPIRRSKRLMDLVFSLLLLLITGPVFLLIIALHLIGQLTRPADRGPLFYREPRISRGRCFDILKFRTVKQPLIDAARQQEQGLKTVKELEQDDTNLTWLGRYLRDYYLDELPQLLNIMRGDMAFVGPRPWPPPDHEAIRRRGYNTKGVIPCGLTGLVQCHKGEGLDDTQLDLDYIEAYRTKSSLALLWLDLQIIRRSAKTMAEGKGI